MARRTKTDPPASPVPDTASPRKRRRWGLYIPFIIALVAVVAWTGVWIYAHAEAGRQIEAGAERLRAAGYQVSWTQRRITGYPFRLNITLTNPTIREPSGWGLAAPRLETQAYLHGLDTWVIAAPVGLTFTRPRGGAVNVTGDIIHASISEVNTALPNFSFEGTKLAFAPAAGANPFALTAADKVQMHLRRGPDDQAAVMLKVDNGKAQLSGLFARMAGDKPISIILDSTLSNISAMKGDSWPQMVRNWVAAGGRMTVREAGVTAGDVMIGSNSGILSVARDGRLSGRLDVNLREAPKAIGAMVDTGLIRQQAASAAAIVAAARQGSGATAQANINFEAGQTTLGPVAIGPAPEVY